MTNAPIPIASAPHGAPPPSIRTKAPTHPSQAEPKGTKTSKAQPARSFSDVLTSTRKQAGDAAQSKPERAEDAPSEPTAEIDATARKSEASQLASQSPATDHTIDELSAAERREPVAQGASPGASGDITPEPQRSASIAPPPTLQTDLPAHTPHARPQPAQQIPSTPTPPTAQPTGPDNTPSPQPPAVLQTQSAPDKPVKAPAASPAPNATATELNAARETLQPQTNPAPVQPQPSQQTTAGAGPRRSQTDSVFPTSAATDPFADRSAEDETAPPHQPRAAPAPHAQTPTPDAAAAPTRNSDSIFQLEPAPRAPDSPATTDSNPRQPSATTPTLSKPALATAPPQDAPPAPQLVSRGLTAALAQRGGVVHVRLVPVSLGEVRIHMTLDAGSVSVKIDAATPAAQNLLNEHLGMLRASLESRGIQVDRLAVNLAPPSAAPATHANTSNHSQSNSDLNQSASNNNQQDAAGSQSRGRSDEPNNPNNRNFYEDEPDESLESTQPNKTFNSRLRLRLSSVA